MKGSQRIQRKAGTSSGKIMHSWVELRKIKPQLFEGLEIYQQPSAWVDEVIHSWSLEALAEKYPCSVWSRDSLSTHMTSHIQTCLYWCQALLHIIAGGMTPVLQLADTDFTFPFKAALRRAHERLLSVLKLRSKAAGTSEHLKYSAEDLLTVLQEGMKDVRDLNAQNNLTLAGLRRNGFLAYRPSLSRGVLERSGAQAWAQRLCEGSHRYLPQWLSDLYSWRRCR